MLILAGASQALAPDPRVKPPDTAESAPASQAPATTPKRSDTACRSKDPQDILVCGQRQDFRPDPNVIDADRQERTDERSAASATPAAQAACSAQPAGCGEGLGSIDLANVAIVAGTAVVRAVKGEDWAKAIKVGGPDEYQRYQQAKRRRDAEDAQRTAAQVRMKAHQAERDAHSANSQ
jgi:hypothetical protein